MADAVIFRGGGYEAKLFPEAGGALVSLTKGSVSFFLPCETVEEAKEAPTMHGIPCLFPPNRIDGGRFLFGTREYRFALTSPQKNMFSHGFLHKRAWQVTEQSESSVTVCFENTPASGFFDEFPHPFTFSVRYDLSEDGLVQTVTLRNNGIQTMPVGLGWHTAFALPFVKGSSAENVSLELSVGRRIRVDSRMLPNGHVTVLPPEDAGLRRSEGVSPVDRPRDDHFTNEPLIRENKPFYGGILTDRVAGKRIVYEVDPFYRHWMVFNAKASGSVICLEPQNWRVNAPNLGLPYEEAGLDTLPGGSVLKAVCRLRAEDI